MRPRSHSIKNRKRQRHRRLQHLSQRLTDRAIYTMMTPTHRRRFSKCFSSMAGCLRTMMPHTGSSSIRAIRAASIRRLSRKTTAFCTHFRRTHRSSRARIRRRLKPLRFSKLAAITSRRHQGKEGRWVPLFSELKAELKALSSNPTSKTQEFVINRYRDAYQNLRTTFGKIVKRAGLNKFPRPFDNMRMTRSNEVYRRWGAFEESEWIGHSRRVREDHYLSITDDDFQEAAEWTD